MEPLVGKIIYMIGYWAANFVIRAPYIKAHQRLAIRANRKTRADTGLFLAVGIGGFFLPLLYVFTPLLSFADYLSPLWVGVTGVVVLILGNWVFWRSHKDLGTNWSPTLEIRAQPTLAPHGHYRRIRHPMYLSIWLLVIAQAMILQNYVAGFSGLVPFALLYFLRVPKEERMMREEFGKAYDEYLLATGRILPRF